MSKYDIRKNTQLPSDEEINKYKNFDKVVKKAAILDYKKATKPLYKNVKFLGTVSVIVALGLIFLFESHEEAKIEIPKPGMDQQHQDTIQEPDTNKDTIRAHQAATSEIRNRSMRVTELSTAADVREDQQSTEETNTQTIQAATSSMASFPGGETALTTFLNKHIKYPYNAVENPYSGKVEVSMTIEPSGTITHVHIMNSPNAAITNEINRVIRLMPAWTAASKNGINVASNTIVFFPFVYRNE